MKRKRFELNARWLVYVKNRYNFLRRRRTYLLELTYCNRFRVIPCKRVKAFYWKIVVSFCTITYIYMHTYISLQTRIKNVFLSGYFRYEYIPYAKPLQICRCSFKYKYKDIQIFSWNMAVYFPNNTPENHPKKSVCQQSSIGTVFKRSQITYFVCRPRRDESFCVLLNLLSL